MKNFAIIINESKDKDGTIKEFIEKELKKVFKVCTIKLYKTPRDIKEVEFNTIDIVITIGGDGTILNASKILNNYNIPIFGVNYGNLGFLVSTEKDEFKDALVKLKNKEYYIEDRTMISCDIIKDNKRFTCVALNDIVIAKGTLSRIAKFKIDVDDNEYTKVMADGIIISTPTGSTAYSMSAGGPVIHPTLDVISITPICPHISPLRTIVLSSESKVVINASCSDEIYLTLDGQKSIKLEKEDKVVINKHKNYSSLIRFNDYNYYKILKIKTTPKQ